MEVNQKASTSANSLRGYRFREEHRAHALPPFLTASLFVLALQLTLSALVRAQEPTPASAPAENPTQSNPTEKTKSSDATAPTDQLSIDQARLADRYKRLEEVVGRLAELSAATDPRRAKLLREAIAQSREQDINVRFESIVKLLQDERLAAASTNQSDLEKQLDSLLTLLLKADRDKELTSERDRVQKYLKEVSRLIREQKGIRARTEGEDDLKALTPEQQRIANDTDKLSGNISKTEGGKRSDGDKQPGGESKDGKPSDSGDPPSEKPGDKSNEKDGEKQPGDNSDQPSESKPAGQQKPGDSPSEPSDEQPSDGQPGESGKSPPSKSKPSPGQPSQGQDSQDQNPDQSPPPQEDPADRATDRLKKAQQQMQQALKKLQETERKGASESQLQALKELEQAKAELERVLRQLREEELERTLTQLAARFRKMLEMQTAVYDGTVRLDQVPQAQRTHDNEIESARLSRDESQIVHEVDKALSILHEEGSSVAFPEAVEQMRDDMRQVAQRLADIKPDQLTQSIEKDIIASLEETIAALDLSIKDLEKKRTPPGKQPAAGQPGDMDLVNQIAELKMIRSLQMRINIRTKIYHDMIQADQAETPDLLKSLGELAGRQQRVHQATSDLEKRKKQNN